MYMLKLVPKENCTIPESDHRSVLWEGMWGTIEWQERSDCAITDGDG
jgi:hypothetical protein